ncbi:hypothetical protein HZA45_01115, partial [Candidatus Peregrinibacteria bacterium]|nr:hypothetical protein [Candidatus Peregrinibacteria bacterium]
IEGGKSINARYSTDGGNNTGWNFETVVFSGTGGWTDMSNWSNGYVPTAYDNVRISADVTMNSDYSVESITIDAGKELILGAGYTLETTDPLVIAAGAEFQAMAGAWIKSRINNTGGTITLGDDAIIEYDITNSGTMNMAGAIIREAINNSGTMTFAGTEQIYGGISNRGTMTLTGGETIVLGQGEEITNYAGSTVRYTGGAGVLALKAGTSYYNLEFADSDSQWQADSNLMVNGSFKVESGRFNLGSKQMTVKGDFTAANNQVFDAGTGIVAFDNPGGTSNIHGTTFANLTVTAGTTLIIDENATETITGALTMNGTAESPITLRSRLSGSAWNIDPRGTISASYVNVTDSTNISTINSSITVTGGGTGLRSTGWNFGGSSSTSTLASTATS